MKLVCFHTKEPGLVRLVLKLLLLFMGAVLPLATATKSADRHSGYPILGRNEIPRGDHINIEQRTIDPLVWPLVELAIALGKSVTIRDCVIEGEVTLGARIPTEAPASNLLPQESSDFFGNPSKVWLIKGSISISESYFLNSIVVGPSDVIRGARSSNQPIVFLHAPQLVNNTFGGYGLWFNRTAFTAWPSIMIIGNSSRVRSARRMLFTHCWFAETLNSNEPLANFSDNDLDLHLSGSYFSRGVLFKRAKFPRTADFRDVVFNGDADFTGSVFEDRADFTHATFRGDVDMSHAHFKDIALFEAARVQQSMTLSGATFDAGASFAGWALRENTSLDLSSVRSQRPLLGLTFTDLQAPLSRHEKKILEDSAALQREYERDPRVFTAAWNAAQIRGQDLGDLVGSKENSPKDLGELLSPRMIPAIRTVLRWEKISALRSLEASSRELGLRDDAFAAMRERRALERADRNRVLAFFDWLVDLTCGYGTQLGSVLKTAILLIAFFACIYIPFGVKEKGKEHGGTVISRLTESLLFSSHIFMRVGHAGWEPTLESSPFKLPYPRPSIRQKFPWLTASRQWTSIEIPNKFTFKLPYPRPSIRQKFPWFTATWQPTAIEIRNSFTFWTTLEGTVGWLTLALFVVTLGKLWTE